MDDAVNVERLIEEAREKASPGVFFEDVRENQRQLIIRLSAALDAANDREVLLNGDRLELRGIIARYSSENLALFNECDDLRAQLALAAPLLEAGYAYREARRSYAQLTGNGPHPSILAGAVDRAENAFLAAAIALPPRDGGQAVG